MNNLTWKTGILYVLIIAAGVAGGLKLNEVINRARMPKSS